MRERHTQHSQFSPEQEEWESERGRQPEGGQRREPGRQQEQYRGQGDQERQYGWEQGGHPAHGTGTRESYGQSRSPGSQERGPGGFRQQEGFERGEGYAWESEAAYGRGQFGGGYGREGASQRGEGYGGGMAPGSYEQGGAPRGFGRGESAPSRARGEWGEGHRAYPYGEEGWGRTNEPAWHEPAHGRAGTYGSALEGDLGRGRKGPKGYVRSDERIREFICERLVQYHQLDVSDVTVNVKDGEVTLEGTVPERHMKYRIEDVADSCWGVKDVDNRLRVAGGSAAEAGGAMYASGGNLGSSEPSGSPGAGTTQTGVTETGATQAGSATRRGQAGGGDTGQGGGQAR